MTGINRLPSMRATGSLLFGSNLEAKELEDVFLHQLESRPDSSPDAGSRWKSGALGFSNHTSVLSIFF